VNNHISPAEAVNLIRSTKGGFFGVEFIKKDGSRRKMLARTGVKKGVKEGAREYTPPLVPRHITVWDRHAGGYRKINVNTIQTVAAKGQRFTVA